MSATKKYVVKATIEHMQGGKVSVELEGSGFVGKGEAYDLSIAFDHAYGDLMAKVSETIFTEDVQ